MSAHTAVDRAQRRFSPLGYPIAVVYKFFDDMGSYLGALLAFYAFVSLFPLLILATTILGIVLNGDPGLQQDLLKSALGEFPIISDQITKPTALSGSWVSITTSTLVALYGALGAAQAFQYIANSVWQVPRNSRPNPFTARGKSIGLIALLGTALLATIGLTQVVPRLVHLEGLASFGIQVGTVGIDVVAIMVAYHVGTSRSLSWRDIWPGAVFASIMWQLLQRFGGIYVQHIIKRNSAIDPTLALVVGLMLFLFIAGIIIVISMELNAVWTLRLWPRALLTPFTDNVQLTDADVRAYSGLARATRLKGFQQIDIGFDKPPEPQEKSGVKDRPEHEEVPLPLDFGDGEAAATEPVPTRAARAPHEAHRLPSPQPSTGPEHDERTIPSSLAAQNLRTRTRRTPRR
ncbi:YhjD/YihY/BrkB family envelope integrity protein [Flexivirga alba]|uniref:YhjD/YihY/BrkB family envelope integrity protein n=1 Tax=Flexivirga alba TaxID=702742 RepID=A0ABW2AM81_9MICO